MNTIRKIVGLLSRREKRRLILITASFVLMALFEVAGVGSIGPFISVASDPEAIGESGILSSVYRWLGFHSQTRFLVLLGIVVFVLIVGSNAFTSFTLYAAFKYVGMRRYSLGLKLFRRYLYQPYAYFLDHNTSELSKNLLTEIDQVVNGVLYPAMEACARGLVGIAMFTLLIVMNPVVGLVAGTALGTGYMLVYAIVRTRLNKLGLSLRESNKVRFKATAEAFGAIKDVKIMAKEAYFEQQYAVGSKGFAQNQASQRVFSTVPKYIIEALAFGLVVLLVVVLIGKEGDIKGLLPLFSVYVFAGYRLMPALQIVFRGVSHVRYYSHTVDALSRDIAHGSDPKLAAVDVETVESSVEPVERRRLEFEREVQVENVSYGYPSSRGSVLDSISLCIRKNTTIGLVGATGCGKTTLVDVILGLLERCEGRILVDGVEITAENTRLWQKNLGYVPQQIFLCDDSVTANIAFGIPRDSIDAEAVRQAAKIANLHDFVTQELPDGYETIVGERGIRFSGGQRQRVGIARALYHDPDILVLDEATSALDTVTEDAVMDAIHNLMHAKTIIIIAHRVTTLRDCDSVFLMERGRISATGTYRQLLADNETFKAMARVEE